MYAYGARRRGSSVWTDVSFVRMTEDLLNLNKLE